MAQRPQGLATIAVHAGVPEGGNSPLTTPIVQSTTYRFESAAQVQAYQRGEGGLFMYSRDENPTVRAAEEAVARIEGAEAAVLFASGMGAMTTALLGLVSAGDEVIAASALYGGTYKLLRDVLSRFAVRLRPVAPEDLAKEVVERPAKLCVFESPTNPTLRIVDVARVAEACRKARAVSVIDSTFGPPVLQHPLESGVDVVMHSATKYLNGHSDHLLGVLLGARERIEPLRLLSRRLGAAVDPQAAYDLLRSLKTLPIRMERHCSNALRIATWLEAQPAVRRVYYPGLESHPDYTLARKQMSAFGGMVTFSLGDKERAFRFWDRQKLIARAASLGGTESISSLPILFSHTGYSREELARAGVDEGMVRLSVGLEDPEDLIADLSQALG
ncbi:MAG: PLP-dependent transferase [Deltaproteobacteria bacterium]|nr:MAG: PLP-dependent transferase [Deltaproteobacteria bacterium]TMB33590.1 MAG: PLP-dependent transferase [Deltaproteobacteria bacterium]